jgi:hypothetical protein
MEVIEQENLILNRDLVCEEQDPQVRMTGKKLLVLFTGQQ